MAIAHSTVHDMHNVFASILLASHALAAAPNRACSKELIRSVNLAIQQGRGCLDLLMACCRGAGLEHAELPVELLIEAAVRVGRGRLRSSHQIVTDYESDLPLVRTRPAHFLELLLALLTEASRRAPTRASISIHGAKATSDGSFSTLQTQEPRVQLVLLSPINADSEGCYRAPARLEDLATKSNVHLTLLAVSDTQACWQILLGTGTTPAAESRPNSAIALSSHP